MSPKGYPREEQRTMGQPKLSKGRGGPVKARTVSGRSEITLQTEKQSSVQEGGGEQRTLEQKESTEKSQRGGRSTEKNIRKAAQRHGKKKREKKMQKSITKSPTKQKIRPQKSEINHTLKPKVI